MADGGGEDRTVKQEGSQRKCVNLASILKLLLKRLICVPAKQGHLHRHFDAPGDFGRGRGAGTRSAQLCSTGGQLLPTYRPIKSQQPGLVLSVTHPHWTVCPFFSDVLLLNISPGCTEEGRLCPGAHSQHRFGPGGRTNPRLWNPSDQIIQPNTEI